MRKDEFVYGLMSDILSSLGTACIMIVIAFVIALVAGWVDIDLIVQWFQNISL